MFHIARFHVLRCRQESEERGFSTMAKKKGKKDKKQKKAKKQTAK